MVKSYINLAEKVDNKMNTQLFYRAMLLKILLESGSFHSLKFYYI